MGLTTRKKWLLVLVDSIPYVQGNTRLQKYALFVSKSILKDEFYKDWKAWKFGGFSQQLAQEFSKLCNDSFVEKNKIGTFNGKPIYRYSLSATGKDSITEFQKEHARKILDIHSITHFYFDKTWQSLVADSYSMFPELVSESTIKPEINQEQIELDSLLSSKLEIPIDPVDESGLIPNANDVAPTEFPYNDEDARRKLADMIGLKEIPKPNATAVDKLAGIFSSKITSERIDSVDMVRHVRGSV